MDSENSVPYYHNIVMCTMYPNVLHLGFTVPKHITAGYGQVILTT
jgi:hypothetical protein